uniref:Uncharacterized protein n=1 Tax=Anopheles atroparvus TaxID=41427 RepID=A0A182J9T6_ANOAO
MGFGAINEFLLFPFLYGLGMPKRLREDKGELTGVVGDSVGKMAARKSSWSGLEGTQKKALVERCLLRAAISRQITLITTTTARTSDIRTIIRIIIFIIIVAVDGAVIAFIGHSLHNQQHHYRADGGTIRPSAGGFYILLKCKMSTSSTPLPLALAWHEGKLADSRGCFVV